MWRLLVGKLWRKIPPQARRAVVRLTQPSFTVSAAVIVVNRENQILLLNHVLRPGSGWGMPGGFLNSGEQPANAAKREVLEETGLKIGDLRFVTARTLRNHVEFIFIAKADGAARAASREVLEARWFEIGAIPAEVSRLEREFIRQALETAAAQTSFPEKAN